LGVGTIGKGEPRAICGAARGDASIGVEHTRDGGNGRGAGGRRRQGLSGITGLQGDRAAGICACRCQAHRMPHQSREGQTSYR
jgi:hypothetical protein